VTGYTYSTDFPTQNPFQGSNAGSSDVFVTKLSSSGNTLSYSTYLGGTSDDYGYAIAVDSTGAAYVTGYTYSTNFPTKNPFQGPTRMGTWRRLRHQALPLCHTSQYHIFLGSVFRPSPESLCNNRFCRTTCRIPLPGI
jgi:hypothetical protein